MSTLVIPKVWAFQEELVPAHLNGNFAAAALSLNNIQDVQVVAGAGIPKTKFSTTPGKRVTGAQVQDEQITAPKLAGESVFFDKAGGVTDQTLVNLTTTKKALASVNQLLDGFEWILATVVGRVILPFDAGGYSSTVRFELDFSGLPLATDQFLTMARPGSAGGPSVQAVFQVKMMAFIPSLGSPASLPVVISGKVESATAALWVKTSAEVQMLGVR